MLQGDSVLYLHLLSLLLIKVFSRAGELLVQPVHAFQPYEKLYEEPKQRTCGSISGKH